MIPKTVSEIGLTFPFCIATSSPRFINGFFDGLGDVSVTTFLPKMSPCGGLDVTLTPWASANLSPSSIL